MSAIDDIEAAIARQRQENAAAVQVHRADSKALADMTAKLNAAITGQITDVDIAKLVGEINDAAQELHSGITDTHVEAVGSQTANAGASHVQGGSTAGPDVVSASSPGVVKPAATDIPNSAVPDSLGGGAMPAREPTIGATGATGATGSAEGATGSTGTTGSVVSPAVPSVEDVPSDVHDNVPDSAKKG